MKISIVILITICAQISAQTDAQTARIPGGTFMRGGNDGNDDEKPVREITISAFSMMTKEVTEA
ncbi:MAG: formylglycine-generating enzyme family protein, partial [Treponema sp.]|nr:formylglycine-generating enzyme family protein [Treponema sp.]